MKTLSVVISSVLSAAVIALAVVLPTKKAVVEKTAPFTILTLWHIDGFEGGVGSRASYLKKVSREFEKENGCLINVVSETAFDAKEKIKSGVLPDIISYSSGIGEAAGLIVELDKTVMSAGGEAGGRYYASSWAYGGYVVITHKGETVEKTVVSQGDTTFPVIACMLGEVDVRGATALPPQRAYERFIADKSARLIGTQRDIYRLKNKIDDFEITPVAGFTDLIQYVSVIAGTDKTKIAKKFAAYLASDGQEGVHTLGLMSGDKTYNIADNGLIDRLYSVNYDKTLPIFLSDETLNELNAQCEKYLSGGEADAEFIKNTVKSLK